MDIGTTCVEHHLMEDGTDCNDNFHLSQPVAQQIGRQPPGTVRQRYQVVSFAGKGIRTSRRGESVKPSSTQVSVQPYSKSCPNHLKHLELALQILRNHTLYAN
ncbi:hypothetical protein ACLOJK_019826 [Asimina triloba]